MRIYETTIKYTLVSDGPIEALTNAEKVANYMRDAFDELPLSECFYVICLNRKNKPLGRHKISTGTATCALAHPREVFRIACLSTASAILIPDDPDAAETDRGVSA